MVDSSLLFLSGPMSGLPDDNYPAFEHSAYVLRHRGYHVLSPHELGRMDGWTWRDYVCRSVMLMLVAAPDGVATLDGADESPGARVEIDIAGLVLGCPIKPVHLWEPL